MYIVKIVIATTGKAQPCYLQGQVVDNVNTCFQSIIPQNRGTNNMYLGDPTMAVANDNTLGLEIPPLNSLGSAQAFSSNPGDLKDYFVMGTAGDYLVIMVIP